MVWLFVLGGMAICILAVGGARQSSRQHGRRINSVNTGGTGCG